MKIGCRDAFLQHTAVGRQILQEGRLISINVLSTANRDIVLLVVKSKQDHGAPGGAVVLRVWRCLVATSNGGPY